MQDLVKISLEKIFKSKALIRGKVIKISAEFIDSLAFTELNTVYKHRGVAYIDIKRSGTGLTVLVTLN